MSTNEALSTTPPSSDYRSTLSRAQLEAKIPGGPTTPEASRRLGVTNEVIETDAAGFPTVVRQKVRNRFLKLVEQGVLSEAEAKAANLLRELADRCTGRMLPSYQMKVDCSGGRPHDAMVANWDARTKVEDALKRLNSELRKVAVAYILEERVAEWGAASHQLVPIIIGRQRTITNGLRGKCALDIGS